jgi:hypothetical protein
MGECVLDPPRPGCGQVPGSCEHGNERLGCIQCWDYLEWLSNYQVLKLD